MNALTALPVRDAYAYVRISSQRQKHGDGLRRQHELALGWIERSGARLVEVLRDEGLSAFTGAHISRGELGRFMRRIEAGEIPAGSILVLESLDRLSREEVRLALVPFLSIINAGIEVVTVQDERRYHKDSPGLEVELVLSLLLLARGHNESVVKLRRQRDTWIEKRRKLVEEKVPLTQRAPAWLTWSRGKWVINRQRAKIVRRIFKELAEGVGRDKIARRLNAEGVPPFAHGRSWHGGTVQKLTDNKAVIGWVQPHKLDGKKRIPVGEPVRIFPVIVAETLFIQARTSAESRRQGTHNTGGRKGTLFSNLFSGMTFCAHCNAPMNYRDRGPRSTPCLRCSGERNGTCDNRTRYSYRSTEDALIRWLSTGIFTSESADAETKRLTQTLAEKRLLAERLQKRIDALIEVQVSSRNAAQAIVDAEVKLLECETNIGELCRQLDLLGKKVGGIDRRKAVEEYRSNYLKCTTDAERYALRAKLHQHFKAVISGIRCYQEGFLVIDVLAGALTFVLHSDGQIVVFNNSDSPDIRSRIATPILARARDMDAERRISEYFDIEGTKQRPGESNEALQARIDERTKERDAEIENYYSFSD